MQTRPLLPSLIVLLMLGGAVAAPLDAKAQCVSGVIGHSGCGGGTAPKKWEMDLVHVKLNMFEYSQFSSVPATDEIVAAVVFVLEQWNSYPGIKPRLQYAGTTTDTQPQPGQIIVVLKHTIGCCGCGAQAEIPANRCDANTGRVTGALLFFPLFVKDSSCNVSPSPTIWRATRAPTDTPLATSPECPFTNSCADFIGLLHHELGHGMGLDHSCDGPLNDSGDHDAPVCVVADTRNQRSVMNPSGGIGSTELYSKYWFAHGPYELEAKWLRDCHANRGEHLRSVSSTATPTRFVAQELVATQADWTTSPVGVTGADTFGASAGKHWMAHRSNTWPNTNVMLNRVKLSSTSWVKDFPSGTYSNWRWSQMGLTMAGRPDLSRMLVAFVDGGVGASQYLQREVALVYSNTSGTTWQDQLLTDKSVSTPAVAYSRFMQSGVTYSNWLLIVSNRDARNLYVKTAPDGAIWPPQWSSQYYVVPPGQGISMASLGGVNVACANPVSNGGLGSSTCVIVTLADGYKPWVNNDALTAGVVIGHLTTSGQWVTDQVTSLGPATKTGALPGVVHDGTTGHWYIAVPRAQGVPNGLWNYQVYRNTNLNASGSWTFVGNQNLGQGNAGGPGVMSQSRSAGASGQITIHGHQ